VGCWTSLLTKIRFPVAEAKVTAYEHGRAGSGALSGHPRLGPRGLMEPARSSPPTRQIPPDRLHSEEVNGDVREALFHGGLWPGSLRFVLAPFLGLMAAAPWRISLMRQSDK